MGASKRLKLGGLIRRFIIAVCLISISGLVLIEQETSWVAARAGQPPSACDAVAVWFSEATATHAFANRTFANFLEMVDQDPNVLRASDLEGFALAYAGLSLAPTQAAPPLLAHPAAKLLRASLAAKSEAITIFANSAGTSLFSEFDAAVGKADEAEGQVGTALADLINVCEFRTDLSLTTEIHCVDSLNVERSDFYKSFMGTYAYIMVLVSEVNDALELKDFAKAQQSLNSIRTAASDFEKLEVPLGAEAWQASILRFMTELANYMDAKVGNAAGRVSPEALTQADQQFQIAAEQMDLQGSNLFFPDCNRLASPI